MHKYFIMQRKPNVVLGGSSSTAMALTPSWGWLTAGVLPVFTSWPIHNNFVIELVALRIRQGRAVHNTGIRGSRYSNWGWLLPSTQMR